MGRFNNAGYNPPLLAVDQPSAARGTLEYANSYTTVTATHNLLEEES
jgi:hypothetical protein